jgi:hypothetical protein
MQHTVQQSNDVVEAPQKLHGQHFNQPDFEDA